jgi:glucose/arabinose dehydrogenase
MATIEVKATATDKRVAFYETDVAHPGGQAFVVGDGVAVAVGETPGVLAAIQQGKLVIAQTPTVTKQTPRTQKQSTTAEETDAGKG